MPLLRFMAITPCSDTTVLRYLSHIGCIFSVEGDLAFVTLASPLPRGGRFTLEAVHLQDLDIWYCNRYLSA